MALSRTTGALFVFMLVAACAPSEFHVDAKDIEVKDPAIAVAEARRMIREHRQNQYRHDGILLPKDLPEALRIKGLEAAIIHEDHIDLNLGRVRGEIAGARIWSEDSSKEHADAKTSYTNIYFYRFNAEFPDHSGNIP